MPFTSAKPISISDGRNRTWGDLPAVSSGTRSTRANMPTRRIWGSIMAMPPDSSGHPSATGSPVSSRTHSQTARGPKKASDRCTRR